MKSLCEHCGDEVYGLVEVLTYECFQNGCEQEMWCGQCCWEEAIDQVVEYEGRIVRYCPVPWREEIIPKECVYA